MNNIKMYLLLVIVMFIWGMNLPALKYLTAQMDPVIMTSLRIFIASISIFFMLSLLKSVYYPSKKEWVYILGGAILNVVIHHYFLSVGLTMTTGTNAGLILGTSPILTAIVSLIMLRIHPTLLQWLGFVLGLVGVWIIILVGSSSTSTISMGDSFVFIAIVSQVFSFVIIKKVTKTLDPRLLTAYMFLIGSILLFFIGIMQNPSGVYSFKDMSPVFWIIMLASAVIATAFGHMLYNYSIYFVGPGKTAIFINLSTIFSLLGAAIFLGERIHGLQIIGLTLIAGGVLFGSGAVEELKNRKKRNMTQ